MDNNNKLKKVDELTEFSKVMPSATTLEEAVLGACMLDKDGFAMVMDILCVASFYDERHQIIWQAMLNLFSKTQPIDLLTVTEEIKKMGELEFVTPFYLVELTNRVASAANIEFHARIIEQKFIRRTLIHVSTEAVRLSFDESYDVFQVLDHSEQALYDIMKSKIGTGARNSATIISEVLKDAEKGMEAEGGITGLPTGLTDLDRLTKGWQPTDLIIVAARPGMGKTSFTLQLGKHAALEHKKPVALFSLEMSDKQLMARALSQEAEIQSSKIATGQMEEYEWQQLGNAAEKLADMPLFIDDLPSLSIMEFRAKCRRLKLQQDIQLVIIDYLQLMNAGADFKGNREQEISAISRGLKAVAKELGVPVIALSQLSRAVETRGGTKRPQLSDLRESGALEQDADIVSFLYRPEYYQILEDEEGQSLKGVMEIIVAKHRNGALKTVKVKFQDHITKFSDLDDPNFDDVKNQIINSPSNNVITRNERMNDDDIPF